MSTAESKEKKENKGKKRKWRSFDFIIDNEQKNDDKCPGVQRWLNEKELVNKMHNDPNFKSMASHSRLKKEMTEASSQTSMIDWITNKFDDKLLETKGNDYVIIDICSGKGFFGVLICHILSQSQIILMDKNKKMNLKHFDSCSNVSFNIVDIRAYKFSLSEWIRTEFKKYNKSKLILFGCHLCGELSQTVIDAFNELSDIASALFLVPCCFPKKDKIVNKAKELNMETMDYWLKLLKDQVERKKDDHLLLECIKMDEMLSEKNHLIRIVRKDMFETDTQNGIKRKLSDNDNKNKNEHKNENETTSNEPPSKKQKIVT